MKKYQELENKIKELQAEVERLKNEEKTNELPEKFDRNQVIKFLQEPCLSNLITAFNWATTPQGDDYWNEIAVTAQRNKKYKVPDEAIIQLQKWVIQSFQKEYETSS